MRPSQNTKRDRSRPWSDRASSTERGYDWQWRKLRLRILARDCHLCQCPQCLGGELRTLEASEVDHIVPKAQGGTDDPANLRAIHPECHRRITLEQQGYTSA